jgi:hypothetical protein
MQPRPACVIQVRAAEPGGQKARSQIAPGVVERLDRSVTGITPVGRDDGCGPAVETAGGLACGLGAGRRGAGHEEDQENDQTAHRRLGFRNDVIAPYFLRN